MNIFFSKRELYYWILVLITFLAILSSLFYGPFLVGYIINHKLQGIVFGVVFLMILTTLLIYGLKLSTKITFFATLLVLVGIYLLLFVRLTIYERTHLIEYGLLSIFIHEALTERLKNRYKIGTISIFSFCWASCFGLLDESIQIFIPSRNADLQDILFNTFVIISTLLTLNLLRLFKSKKINSIR